MDIKCCILKAHRDIMAEEKARFCDNFEAFLRLPWEFPVGAGNGTTAIVAD